ncbi:MAG: hypothetical protein WB821_12260, partial [Burkholderiaceae bacterium]
MEISVADIGPAHFVRCAVWEYFEKPGSSEVMVRSVENLPTLEFDGRIVVVCAVLACGRPSWLALTGFNLDPEIARISVDAYLYSESGAKSKITNRVESF